MKETKHKSPRPAILFGQKCVKNVGYIDDYIFACEIEGGDHIRYSRPRRPRYHLVIIVLKGEIEIIINGERMSFGKHSYINLPTWADIYEIRYGDDFHGSRRRSCGSACDRRYVYSSRNTAFTLADSMVRRALCQK